MNRKQLAALLVCLLLLTVVSSCDLLNSLLEKPKELEIDIQLNKEIYENNESINVILDVQSKPGRDISISWKLDGENPKFAIINDKNFSFNLTPATTKTYILEATVSDGIDTITKSIIFTVKQLPLIGTWKTTNVSNPAYYSNKDIIGIWNVDRFEIYYLDANGGTEIKTYSARGIMDYPSENTWIKLTQQEYYDANNSYWKQWTNTDGVMWVKYNSSIDKLTVTIQLDMTTPADSAQYTWVFTKIDDNIVIPKNDKIEITQVNPDTNVKNGIVTTFEVTNTFISKKTYDIL